MTDRKKEQSLSLSYVKRGYVRDAVRPYVQKPLHGSSFCRRNKYVIVEESDEACCCNCDGNQVPEFPECPVRMREVAVARIKTIQQVSYVEAVKIAEGGSRDEMVVDVPQSIVNAMQEKITTVNSEQ
jgi:hypothetical protein